MKSPEQKTWHGIVVPWIATVQEAQDLLVDEVEPEEPVIRARLAVHREVKNRRVADGCEYVPGQRDCQEQDDSRRRPEAVPCVTGHESAGGSDVDYSDRGRK